MTTVFMSTLRLSFEASFMILAVIAMRLVLKKAPRRTHCLLWGLVGLKLLIPFSIESRLSLLPDISLLPRTLGASGNPSVYGGLAHAISSEASTAPAGIHYAYAIVSSMSVVWLAGAAAVLLGGLIDYARIARTVRDSVLIEHGVEACDGITSPFILGILKPRIYVPYGLQKLTLDMVLAHERVHIRNRDHIWKLAGFALLAFHWFNPLVWVAYMLLCKDIEMACDEEVIRCEDNAYKAAYAEALLTLSASRQYAFTSSLAFGQVSVKERIERVLKYKKPAFVTFALAAASCIFVAACFMTSPENQHDSIAKEVQEKEMAAEKAELERKMEIEKAELERKMELDIAKAKKEAELQELERKMEIEKAKKEADLQARICCLSQVLALLYPNFDITVQLNGEVGSDRSASISIAGEESMTAKTKDDIRDLARQVLGFEDDAIDVAVLQKGG